MVQLPAISRAGLDYRWARRCPLLLPAERQRLLHRAALFPDFLLRHQISPALGRRAAASDLWANLLLEVIWIIIPFILVMVMFGWGASLYFTAFTPPRDALEIFVVGKQWMWKVQHPEGRREIDELHVPLGYPVKVTITSQDVIHSFYVPAFRIKMDVVPGRYTSTWFEASKTGTYHLFCAEYCGTAHAGMGGRVVVMKPSEYEQWLRIGAPRGIIGGGGWAALPAAGL